MTTRYPHVHYRWDVDKTYIHTEFDSLRDLLRMWRQTPEEKKNIPGAPALLRELLAKDRATRNVSFISGSPRQMRDVLLKKFELDGIQPASLVLKPNVGNILQLKLRDVHNQIGYKLEVLLSLRVQNTSEFLFGDDSEQDALIYSLYSDLLRGALPADEFQELLTLAGLYPAAVERLLRQYLNHRTDDGHVERIFIHLDRRSPVTRFIPYGWRVVPVYNWFQAAVVLVAMGQLDILALHRIAEEMQSAGYSPTRLSTSVTDLIRRGYVSGDDVEVLCNAAESSLPVGALTSEVLERARSRRARIFTSAVVQDAAPDYRTIFEARRWRRIARPQFGRPWLSDL